MPADAKDNIIFIQEARALLRQLETARADAAEQDLQTQRLEKSLAAEKKAVADSIELTVRRRKAEITDSYDTQLKQTQNQLKKEWEKRDKAKNQGIKARMKEETADLREENRRRGTELSTLFRQNNVPRFCNTLFFYSLYYARGFREILVFLCTLLICFLAVPVGLYYGLRLEGVKWLIVIYVVDIFIFGGLYFAINNHVRVRHHETLLKGRRLRNQIRAGERQIRAVKDSIRKDKNEDMYDLGRFDKKIAALEEEKEEIAAQKQSALTGFETSGRVLLAQEITENNQARISSLEAELEAAEQVQSDFQAQVKVLAMQMAERYEPFLDREFLQDEKLALLEQVFENGMAANLTEAQELVRAGKVTPVLSARPELPENETEE